MATATKKYPNPVYAAAGAGELAYQRLRQLPGKLAGLRERIAVRDIDVKADFARLRTAAQRTAEAMLSEAKSVYADLVVRGQQVMAGRQASRAATATTADLATVRSAATEPAAGDGAGG